MHVGTSAQSVFTPRMKTGNLPAGDRAADARCISFQAGNCEFDSIEPWD